MVPTPSVFLRGRARAAPGGLGPGASVGVGALIAFAVERPYLNFVEHPADVATTRGPRDLAAAGRHQVRAGQRSTSYQTCVARPPA